MPFGIHNESDRQCDTTSDTSLSFERPHASIPDNWEGEGRRGPSFPHGLGLLLRFLLRVLLDPVLYIEQCSLFEAEIVPVVIVRRRMDRPTVQIAREEILLVSMEGVKRILDRGNCSEDSYQKTINGDRNKVLYRMDGR